VWLRIRIVPGIGSGFRFPAAASPAPGCSLPPRSVCKQLIAEDRAETSETEGRRKHLKALLHPPDFKVLAFLQFVVLDLEHEPHERRPVAALPSFDFGRSGGDLRLLLLPLLSDQLLRLCELESAPWPSATISPNKSRGHTSREARPHLTFLAEVGEPLQPTARRVRRCWIFLRSSVRLRIPRSGLASSPPGQLQRQRRRRGGGGGGGGGGRV